MRAQLKYLTASRLPLRVISGLHRSLTGTSAQGQDRTSEKGHSSSPIIGLWDSRERGGTKPYLLSTITLRWRFSTTLNLSNLGAFFSTPRAFLTKFRLCLADNGRIVRIETVAHASHEFISASYSCR
jgi:hypothetical protein